jgi:hypothetical protein
LSVTDVLPSPLVVTLGVKFPPTTADPGRFEMLGADGVPWPIKKVWATSLAGAQDAFPAWSASTVHDPNPVKETTPLEIEQLLGVALAMLKTSVNPDVDVADGVYCPPKPGDVGAAPKVVD